MVEKYTIDSTVRSIVNNNLFQYTTERNVDKEGSIV